MTHVVLTDALAFQILDDIDSDDDRCEKWLQLRFQYIKTARMKSINHRLIAYPPARPPLALGMELTQMMVADSDGPHW